MNDKAFATYVAALVTLIGSTLTLLVYSGVANLPPASFLIEHAAVGLAFRASYKSFGGWNPIVDFLEFYGWKSSGDEDRGLVGAVPVPA